MFPIFAYYGYNKCTTLVQNVNNREPVDRGRKNMGTLSSFQIFYQVKASGSFKVSSGRNKGH
jgi:hypothetical protein